jgi:hypothetical protein
MLSSVLQREVTLKKADQIEVLLLQRANGPVGIPSIPGTPSIPGIPIIPGLPVQPTQAAGGLSLIKAPSQTR